MVFYSLLELGFFMIFMVILGVMEEYSYFISNWLVEIYLLYLGFWDISMDFFLFVAVWVVMNFGGYGFVFSS